MFRPGTAEIIAGRSIADGFQGAGLGETLRFASRDWTVVGVFDAGHTGFDSEIWGDAEQMLQAFRRTGVFVDPVQACRSGSVRRGEGRRSKTTRASRWKRSARSGSTRSSRKRCRSSSATSEPASRSSFRSAPSSARRSRCMRAWRRAPARSARCAPSGSRAARSSPRFSAKRCCSACSAAWSGWPGVGDAGAVDFDDQLPDVRRDRFFVHADAADRHRVAGLRARHGLRRRLPAGRTRGANEDRGRVAGRLKRHRARSRVPA